MRKIVFTLMGVVLLAGSYVLAGEQCSYSQSSKGKKGAVGKYGKSGQHKWKETMKNLSLTEKQRKLIKEQKHKSSKNRIRLRTDLKLKQQDLRYEMTKDKIDTGTVNKLVDEISKIQKMILQNKVDSLLEFKGILTQKQWDKIKDFKMMGLSGYGGGMHGK